MVSRAYQYSNRRRTTSSVSYNFPSRSDESNIDLKLLTTTIEFVVCREQILDLRGSFRFLQGNRVDQNGGIWEGICAPLQLSQGSTGRRDCLEDRDGL